MPVNEMYFKDEVQHAIRFGYARGIRDVLLVLHGSDQDLNDEEYERLGKLAESKVFKQMVKRALEYGTARSFSNKFYAKQIAAAGEGNG